MYAIYCSPTSSLPPSKPTSRLFRETTCSDAYTTLPQSPHIATMPSIIPVHVQQLPLEGLPITSVYHWSNTFWSGHNSTHTIIAHPDPHSSEWQIEPQNGIPTSTHFVAFPNGAAYTLFADGPPVSPPGCTN
jgi:hypothetical protein